MLQGMSRTNTKDPSVIFKLCDGLNADWGAPLPLGTQLGKLLVCSGVISEESRLVFTVLVCKGCEPLVLEDAVIGLHNQQVWVHLRLHLGKVRVVEFEPLWGPALTTLGAWSISCVLCGLHVGDSRPLLESTAECVSSRESNDFLVVESHAVENIAQVSCRCISIWEWCRCCWQASCVTTVLLFEVHAAILHVNFWATSYLHLTKTVKLEQS